MFPMVDSLREIKLNAKENFQKMIIENMTHVEDRGDIYSNLLFLKKKAKHMEQKIFKDIPEENFFGNKCLDHYLI